MLNTPIKPIMYHQQSMPIQQQIQNIQPADQNIAQPIEMPNQKVILKEQSMAIFADIQAEINAIMRLNDMLGTYTKAKKEDKNEVLQDIYEFRINMINEMISMRETKINQMETVKAQLDAQLNTL